MEVSTFVQVLKMEPDLPILAFKAKIKNVYKVRESKPGAARKTTYQDLIGTDGTNEIKIVLVDREAMDQSAKGKWFYFCSTKSDKHGWVGVKSKDDTWEEKTTRLVWVTKTAEVSTPEEFEGKGSATAPARTPADMAQQPTQSRAAGPPQQQQKPPQQQQRAPQQQPSGEAPVDRMLEVKKQIIETKRFIGQCVNYMTLTYGAVLAVEDNVRQKHNMDKDWTFSEERFETMMTTFFLAGEKHAMLRTLPYDDLQKYLEYKPGTSQTSSK